MKICFTTYRGSMYCGGQGIYSYYLTKALASLGHEVHLVSGPPYPKNPEGVTLHKVPNPNFFEKGNSAIHNLDIKDIFKPINLYEWITTRFGNFPEILGFSFRAIKKIEELNREINFDVIHDNQCLGYGFFITKQLGLPMVATIHHPLKIDREKSIRESETILGKVGSILYYPMIMQDLSINAFDKLITVSEASVADIEEYFGVPRKNIELIYNGIDEGLFRPVETEEDHKNKLSFLFVGETENKHKGFKILLDAFKKFSENHPSIQLRIINGNSPTSKNTERLIEKSGVKDKIKYLGRVSTPELVEEYSAASAVVMPSLHEGFGLPAIEAMSCGTPLIATTSGALSELISSNSGILVPPNNVDALVEAMEAISENPEKREKMGKEGRRRIENNYTWEEAAKKVTEVYEEIISASNN